MEKSSARNPLFRRKLLLPLLALLLLAGPAGSALASPQPTAETCKLGGCSAKAPRDVTVRLVGVGSYELTLLFQHLLQELDGVAAVEPTRFTLNPRRPRSCYAEWRVTIDRLSLFEFESHLYHRLKEVAADPDGQDFSDLPLDVTSDELTALGHIGPQQATSDSLTFIQRLAFAEPGRVSATSFSTGSTGSWNHGFE